MPNFSLVGPLNACGSKKKKKKEKRLLVCVVLIKPCPHVFNNAYLEFICQISA